VVSFKRLLSYLWTVLLACSLAFSCPSASAAAGQTDGQKVAQKKKSKKKVKKKRGKSRKKVREPAGEEEIEDVEDIEDIEDVEDDQEPTTKTIEKKEEKKEKEESVAKPPVPPPAVKKEKIPKEPDTPGEADIEDLVPADVESDLMDEFDLLMEEEIVYSAAKHQQYIAESPSAITVITREMIEATHCTNVACLMRQVPEVDVRWVISSYAVVGARALTDAFYGDKTMVLVDGREVNIELFGVAIWQALPVHMEEIDRIEVIRGPGSALYGPNAHSMVVAITTRETADSAARVMLGGGEFGLLSLHAGVDQRLGSFRLHTSVSRETTGAWRVRNHREGEVLRGRLRVGYGLGKSTLTLDLGATDIGGLIYTSLGPVRANSGVLGHAFLAYQSDWLRAQVAYSMMKADFSIDLPLYYLDIKMGELPESIEFFSGNLDTDIQLTFSPFKYNLLILGASYRFFTMISDNMDPKTSYEHRFGVFIHDEHEMTENLTLTGSLRLDYNNITPTPVTISPRIALVWRFTETQLVRIAFGQAFRKPCYYNTTTHITGVKNEPGFEGLPDFVHDNFGNPDLENESITALEAGYRGHFFDNSFIVEGDVFYNRYRNTINFHFEMNVDPTLGVPDFGTSVMEFRNEGREIDSLGGSVSLTYRLKKTLRVNLNYTLRYSWYTSASADPTEAGQQGDRVAWEPIHLVNLSLHYLHEKGLRLGLAGHAASESELALPEHGGLFDDVITVENPAMFFLSAYLAWRVNLDSLWIEGGVRAFNALELPFRDTPAVMRSDGVLLGGRQIGRQIFVFIRGSI
jgi:outer membrane receptor for ferrienterochelin and colicin